MASKHGSPKKRNKPFRGIPARGNIIPMAVPIVNEEKEKRRTSRYVMVQKLRRGMGFFGMIQVLGMQLNIGKRILETLFTDQDNLDRACEGLAALIAIKQRLDESRKTYVGCTIEEGDAIVAALNIVDAIEDTVTRLEFADAARYVMLSHGSGANLVKR